MKIRDLLRSPLQKHSRAITLTLALAIVALFMPTLKLPHPVYSYIVFFDITQSMDVEDYELDGVPVSRLTYARHALRRTLRDLPCGSRIGLGAFAEYRTLLLLAPVEVCGNYSDLLSLLDSINGRMRWRNASEITKGVYWSIRDAKQIDPHPNVIFVTDGQEAPPPRPWRQLNFDDVKPGEIHGWLIGAGGYTPRPIPKSDRDGNRVGYWSAEDVIQRNDGIAEGEASQSREHLSALREPHLQQLARTVGFQYARLADASSISRAIRDPRFAQRGLVPTDFYWLPAGAALIVLGWRFLPEFRTRKRS